MIQSDLTIYVHGGKVSNSNLDRKIKKRNDKGKLRHIIKIAFRVSEALSGLFSLDTQVHEYVLVN